jgi:methionyl-tRNA formyltransferase
MRKIKNLTLFFNGERGLGVYKILKKKFNIKAIITNNINIKKKKIHKNILFTKNINLEKNFYKFKSDLFVIAGFSNILKKCIIDVPKYGSINLHAGSLPKYRGGSPLNWQIINNEKLIGLSIIKIDQGIDTGDIIVQNNFKMRKNYNIKKVHNIANKLFPKMTLSAINNIINNQKLIKQGKGTYFKQRNDNDGRIFFKKYSGYMIERLIRALDKPYPGAWCYFDNKIMRIYKAKISKTLKLTGNYGKFIKIKNNYIVKCKFRNLILNKFKIEGNTSDKLRLPTNLN